MILCSAWDCTRNFNLDIKKCTHIIRQRDVAVLLRQFTFVPKKARVRRSIACIFFCMFDDVDEAQRQCCVFQLRFSASQVHVPSIRALLVQSRQAVLEVVIVIDRLKMWIRFRLRGVGHFPKMLQETCNFKIMSIRIGLYYRNMIIISYFYKWRCGAHTRGLALHPRRSKAIPTCWWRFWQIARWTAGIACTFRLLFPQT